MRAQAGAVFMALCLAGIDVPAADTGCVVWIGERGDWDDDASWSTSQEPTVADCVEIADEDTVDVRQAGATCASLVLAPASDASIIVWPGGSLTVPGHTEIGAGTIGILSQIGGSVSLGTVEIGVGGYILAGGDLTASALSLGSAAVPGQYQQSGGTCAIAGTLTLSTTGVCGVSGGTFSVGVTSARAAGGARPGGVGVVSQGTFGVTGGFASVQVAAFTAQAGSIFSPTVGTLGTLSPVEVDGTAQLAGTLRVTDVGAPDGTWDALVAQTIQGDFQAVQLPGPAWSWGIDGNRLWISKSTVPTETATWGRVKETFR